MTFTIQGKLIGLNQYTKMLNKNRYAGNRTKREQQDIIAWAIKQSRLQPILSPVRITYKWYEPNRKRDLDNIASAKKFIQDALVECGILQNDGWKNITGFSDEFYIDKENPRIEVIIKEET